MPEQKTQKNTKEKVAQLLRSGAAVLIEGGETQSLRELVATIEPQSSEIIDLGNEGAVTIEAVRNLMHRLSLKNEKKRIVFIHDAHAMEAVTSNALLKVIEEPPTRVSFVLTSLPYGVLPTIRSRCSLVRVQKEYSNQVAPQLDLVESLRTVEKLDLKRSRETIEAFVLSGRQALVSTGSMSQSQVEVLGRALQLLKKPHHSKTEIQNLIIRWHYA